MALGGVIVTECMHRCPSAISMDSIIRAKLGYACFCHDISRKETTKALDELACDFKVDAGGIVALEKATETLNEATGVSNDNREKEASPALRKPLY